MTMTMRMMHDGHGYPDLIVVDLLEYGMGCINA